MSKKPASFFRRMRLCLWALLLPVLLSACAASAPKPEATPSPEPTAVPAPSAVPATAAPAAPRRIRLGGTSYRQDVTSLALLSGIDPRELAEKLPEFTALETVVVRGAAVDNAVQDSLREQFPHIVFYFPTRLLGTDYPHDAAVVDLSGRELTEEDLSELRENAFRLPMLELVDMTGCGLDGETLHALDLELGDVDVAWTFPVYGVTVCSTDEEIDLSRRSVGDHAAALEEVLPWFSHLHKVVMCHCGVRNEEMDALNKKYEDIRFVWSVYFSMWSLRTDATNFIAARTVNHADLYSSECDVLRYCTDLIALDLGHKNLTDLSFLYNLPKLQYLILVEMDINDITPIGSLSELKYLEVFWTKIEDLSPLINCKNLQDLNICYIYSRPDRAFEVLMQMPWLERLWYCGNALSEEQIAALQANMPQCEMYLAPHGESTGGTWRYHPHYFAMRDVFEMYYMEGGTNGVAADGSQIVRRG